MNFLLMSVGKHFFYLIFMLYLVYMMHVNSTGTLHPPNSALAHSLTISDVKARKLIKVYGNSM
jgi:hypothetical protein